jgi:carboxypeptidase Q
MKGSFFVLKQKSKLFQKVCVNNKSNCFHLPMISKWTGRCRIGVLFFGTWFLIGFQLQAQENANPAKEVSEWLAQNYVGYDLLAKASSEIGHRLTGTENGKAAETFIFDRLKAMGIARVEYDSFSMKAWRRDRCRLEIVPYKSDNHVRMNAVALANTASADAIFHLVDGGDGLEADLKKIAEKIKGKCLIINLGLTRNDSGRSNLHRAEKVALALQYGAAAVLMVHPSPSEILLTGTASLTGAQIPIPVLCVTGKDGIEIRKWMQTEKLMADIKVSNQVAESAARNVIARFPAVEPSDETIVFCGHLDCWDLGTGATDNGLGAFTLLDVARAMEKAKPFLKRNVLIMWTMGEEQGLLGSSHYVKKLKATGQLQQVRAVVNLDMTGNPIGFNSSDWPKAGAWFEKAGAKISGFVPTFTNVKVASPDLHSDHQPFMLEGIPTFSAISQMPDSIYNCYHANCDLMPLIQPAYMETSALVHSLLALELATAKSLPFHSMKPRKLPKWLQKHGLKEKLVISKQWKWKK